MEQRGELDAVGAPSTGDMRVDIPSARSRNGYNAGTHKPSGTPAMFPSPLRPHGCRMYIVSLILISDTLPSGCHMLMVLLGLWLSRFRYGCMSVLLLDIVRYCFCSVDLLVRGVGGPPLPRLTSARAPVTVFGVTHAVNFTTVCSTAALYGPSASTGPSMPLSNTSCRSPVPVDGWSNNVCRAPAFLLWWGICLQSYGVHAVADPFQPAFRPNGPNFAGANASGQQTI